MNSLTHLLSTLKSLREKATATPWERITSGHIITRKGYVTHEWNHGTKGTTDVICQPSIPHNVGIDDENNFEFICAIDDENNFEFICAAVNENAKLCATVELAVEAIQKIADKDTLDGEKYVSHAQGWEGVAEFAREAIDKINEIAKQGELPNALRLLHTDLPKDLQCLKIAKEALKYIGNVEGVCHESFATREDLSRLEDWEIARQALTKIEELAGC